MAWHDMDMAYERLEVQLQPETDITTKYYEAVSWNTSNAVQRNR